MTANEPSRSYSVCLGSSRQTATWKASEMTMDELLERLKVPIRTSETAEEYHRMTKAEKDGIKDKGGFFAGKLKGTRRKKNEVVSRSMITLDCDSLNTDFFQTYQKAHRFLSILYTTHSHLPEAPRARLMMPLARDITPDEYNAIARYLSAEIGMEMVDPCSFEINQMMYWPTVSADGEYIYEVYEGEILDPDSFLKAHPYWKDIFSLPTSAREKKIQNLPKKDQEDPLTKVGAVGDFCRAYSISAAIEKFLPDIYERSDQADRYDYVPGEGRCGVVVYDDKFAYSHHGTDPAGGKLVNAFDLVRIHKFGTDDENLSYRNMCEFALQDEEVQKLNLAEKLAEAEREFVPDDPSWDDPLIFDDEALPPFPMEALPPALREYVAAIAESTQTSVDMSAVGALCAVSAVMRNNYKIAGKDDWLEPTNIYGLIIAEPSERKSAVVSLLTKPIDEYVKRYNEQHKVEFEMSRVTKQRLENKKNSLISASRKKGADEGAEDFNDALQDVVEQLVHFQEKKPLKVYVDDTTPEKLVETLSENNNAISIISSEGGIFDVLSGTYSSKVNIDVFLKAYSGENISVDRIMRNSLSVEEACLTILLSVQPVVIGDLMKNEKFRHRGLTARFLYTHPKSLVGDRNFNSRSIPASAYAGYRDLIFNILAEERGASASIIQLSAEAKEILKEFYDWVEKRLVDEFSVYGDWIGKLVGNTLRIAGILGRSAVMKKNIEGSMLEVDEDIVISGETMSNAIKIGKYFFGHAIRAYSTMGIYSEFQALLKALAKIKEKEMRIICRRDLMRNCRWISSAEEAQRILSGLEDYGYVRLISIDNADKLRGGRPKNPTFAVNPNLFN